MRNSISKTMIASLVALTLGLAVAGSTESAFAGGESTTQSTPGSHNVYNPLAPTPSNEVGSIDTIVPIGQVGQHAINCYL